MNDMFTYSVHSLIDVFLLGDACIPNPCQNGGSCIFDEPSGSFRCYCPPGYTGRSCDIGKFFYTLTMSILHE